MESKSGFVATLGRPNAGKSSLLNAIIGENLALISRKANATRKQLQVIMPYPPLNAQIVFVDTPGIHHREKLLNQYMLSQALSAMRECDLLLYLAPFNDDIKHYEAFLELSNGKKHILLLTKIDLCPKDELLARIAQYQPYKKAFLELMPISVKKGFEREKLLHLIASNLPFAPFFYDEEMLTSAPSREIYKEMIREGIFENLSEEIPYQSDVIIQSCEDNAALLKIYADIIIESHSQKALLIGKNGASIKRVGIYARKRISAFSGKKVFLKLEVVVMKGWSKKKDILKKVGYDFSF